MIPLSEPDLTEDDIAAVLAVLRTPRLSLGPKLEEFEAAVAGFVGVPYGVALSSGTAGLDLSLRALGIAEGDEVILPSFTFVGVANAVIGRRARPVFADIDRVTLNLDPDAVERVITPKTRAIILVHTFGYPAELDPILEIARRHNLRVIEDACEALGAEYRGRKAGGCADLGMFGFYPNKPITTGEGGMVVTRDSGLAETIRALRNQGRRPTDGWLEHCLPGCNYRISEMNCALGVAQMQRIGYILDRRESLAMRYAEKLHTVPQVTLPPLHAPDGRISWFVFVVRLPRAIRDRVWRRLKDRGIQCGRYFAPLHREPLFAPFHNSDGGLPVTEATEGTTLALPFFNRLRDEQITEVCSQLAAAVSDAGL
jgi:perosamine synthetase